MISKNQIKLIKLLEQKKHRMSNGMFVGEGPKVVGDLLNAGFNPQKIFATTEWNNHLAKKYEIVSTDELQKISFLQHPQQVLAIFNIPSESSIQRPQNKNLYIALDGIQDPGNLGTIIRIADWFGISTIYCSENTADAWSPKVVQATMGSIARVKIVYINLHDLLLNTELPVYGTLLDGVNIYQQHLCEEGIIVMGNEGNGISEPIRKLIHNKILIPKYHEGPESLNVAIATAIVCSEFRRRY